MSHNLRCQYLLIPIHILREYIDKQCWNQALLIIVIVITLNSVCTIVVGNVK